MLGDNFEYNGFQLQIWSSWINWGFIGVFLMNPHGVGEYFRHVYTIVSMLLT